VPDYLGPILFLTALVLRGHVRFDVRREYVFVTYLHDDWGNDHLKSPIARCAASLPV